MDWTRAVDIYCERTDASLWSEPVNALTNLAFFAAAWVGWREARRAGRLGPEAWALIGLVALVGVGSGLFHTFAQRWAGAADVLAILVFIVAYFGVALRRFFGLPWIAAVAGAAAFPLVAGQVRSAAAATFPAALQPATGYLPALLLLAVCGGVLAARRHPAGAWLAAGAGLFVASLTFRALDGPLCAAFPLGTHFMWHVLNGAVLGLLLVAFVRHGAAREGAQTAAR